MLPENKIKAEETLNCFSMIKKAQMMPIKLKHKYGVSVQAVSEHFKIPTIKVHIKEFTVAATGGINLLKIWKNKKGNDTKQILTTKRAAV